MPTFEINIKLKEAPRLPDHVIQSPEFATLIQPMIERFEADVRKLIEETASAHEALASRIPPKLTVVK